MRAAAPPSANIREPEPHPSPFEQLRHLLEQLSCCHCKEPLSGFEMAALWLAGDYFAHLPCWAQAQNVIRDREGSS